ncbi:MAG: cobalamin biosynthesis protein CobD [Rhodospirillales bacterium]|nr:cobalamin biosynthesis protein CobD [Rhodospirillales bacterium]
MLIPGSADAVVPLPVLLLAALVLDAAIGGRPGVLGVVPHPVRVIGGLIARCDRTLNRERDGHSRRLALGLLATTLVCGLCGAFGWVVSALTHRFPPLTLVEFALVVALLASRSLFDHVRAVARAVRTGGLDAGRVAVGRIVGRDVQDLDEAGIARAAVESCAENFSDGVVAPVFWTALFGLPGLLVYKAANTLDSMIGHKSARYRAFGWGAARLDDLLNLAPARLSGLLLVAAAGMGSLASGRRAWAAMVRDAGKHRSPNAGWPEAAAAGALDLRLGGPRRYGATAIDAPWLGCGRDVDTTDDIDRMLRLYVTACVLVAGLLAAWAAASLTT